MVGERALWSDDAYVAADPFFGDESDIKCRTVSIRRARRRHLCWGLDGSMSHYIEPGDRHRHEKAIVDGQWGEFRLCLRCMDDFLSSIYPAPGAEEEKDG